MGADGVHKASLRAMDAMSVLVDALVVNGSSMSAQSLSDAVRGVAEVRVRVDALAEFFGSADVQTAVLEIEAVERVRLEVLKVA